MRYLLIAISALTLGALLGACGGGSSSKTPAAEDTASAPATPPSNAAPASTDVASSSTALAGALAPAITVLPDGALVDASGAPVPAAEAPLAAGGPAAPAAGAPADSPTSEAPVSTPLAPPTPATSEAPLCVVDPSPGCRTAIPVSTAIVPAAQGIVIDADPSTPAVETGPINAASGQSFTVGINVATAPQPYEGYEWDLVIDGPIRFVSSDETKPASLTVCSTTTRIGPEGTNEYYGGCLSTNKNLNYTGPVGTVTLQCTGPGSGALRLRKQNAGSPFGTDLLNQNAEPITGDVGPAVTVACP